MSTYLKNIIQIICLFIFTFSICLSAEQTIQTKQELWDAMSVEVGYWIDGAGYPIDKGVKDVVIALNLLDIETTASCEGHMEHGLPYPWIGIQTDTAEVQNIMKELAANVDEMAEEETKLLAKFPDLAYTAILDLPEAENYRNHMEKCECFVKMVAKMQLNCSEPLKQLLNQFYENRKTVYDNVLFIKDNCSIAELRSIGAERQVLRAAEEQAMCLEAYQQEMRAFTAFLKQKFLNSN